MARGSKIHKNIAIGTKKTTEKTEICFQELCGINGHNIAVVLW